MEAKALDRLAGKLLGFMEEPPRQPVVKNILVATELIVRATKSLTAAIHAPMNPPMLLIGYHLEDYLEDITDKSRDAVNFIKVIAMKSK
jgi:hypothetical protein